MVSPTLYRGGQADASIYKPEFSFATSAAAALVLVKFSERRWRFALGVAACSCCLLARR